MNNQEAFDIAAKHLLTQNKQSARPIDGRCLYRGPNGLMCAVGALIPDELYEARFEVYTADELTTPFAQKREIAKYFKGVDPGLLSHLQNIHDRFKPEEWAELLIDCAECFGLNSVWILEYKK